MSRIKIAFFLAAALCAQGAQAQFGGDEFNISLDDKPKKPERTQRKRSRRRKKTRSGRRTESPPTAKSFRNVDLKGYFTVRIPPWQWEFLPKHSLLGRSTGRDIHNATRWSFEYRKKIPSSLGGEPEERRIAREDANNIVIDPDLIVAKESYKGISFRQTNSDCRGSAGSWNAEMSVVYYPGGSCRSLKKKSANSRRTAKTLPDSCRTGVPRLKVRSIRKCYGEGRGVYELLFSATANVFDDKHAYLKRVFDSFSPLLVEKSPGDESSRSGGLSGHPSDAEGDKFARTLKKKLREQTVYQVMRSLKKNKNPLVRAFAALELGNRGAKAKLGVMALIQALGDKEFSVRMSAAWALGRIGRPARKAIPALRRASADPNEEVGQAALNALQRLER